MAVEVRAVDVASEPNILDQMDGVMMRAYGMSSFRQSIERFAVNQPDSLIVGEEIDSAGVRQVVGAGCGVGYPDGGFGWIGLIAVDPERQRRGIGELITGRIAQFLADHGCASALDASPSGAPLYARMGFVDHGPTRVLAASDALRADPPPAGDLIPVDLGVVEALDRQAFGARRRGVLAALVAQNDGRHAMAVDAYGQVSGYVIAGDQAIGPLVAVDGPTVRRLVGFAMQLDWESAPRIFVPPRSAYGPLLGELGFEELRRLRHMHRGIDALPGDERLIAGRVSLGEG